MTLKIEEITLSKLILNESYCRKVMPFIKREYFDGHPNGVLFETLTEYVSNFDTNPEPNALKIEVEVESRFCLLMFLGCNRSAVLNES